ncbi:cyclopropane fatty-acyl-phospholipid synthase-like methyltransferase [Streptomyces sp. TE33382]
MHRDGLTAALRKELDLRPGQRVLDVGNVRR